MSTPDARPTARSRHRRPLVPGTGRIVRTPARREPPPPPWTTESFRFKKRILREALTRFTGLLSSEVLDEPIDSFYPTLVVRGEYDDISRGQLEKVVKTLAAPFDESP